MKETLKVLFYNFSEGSLLPSQIEAHFKMSQDTVFEIHNTPVEVGQAIKDSAKSLFIFIAKDQQDFSQAKLLLKKFGTRIQNKELYPIAILGEHNNENINVIRNLGCADIFNFKVTPEHIIELIEAKEDEALLNDPDLLGFDGLIDGDDEDLVIFQGMVSQDLNDEARITSVNTPSENEELHNYSKTHPKLGGISLESGHMELSISGDLPSDSKFILEHFEENKIEFEVRTDEAVKLSKDQEIDVEVVFVYDRCRVQILLQGVIEDIEPQNGESTLVSVHLNQDETMKLEQFMALYQKRQSQISEFMDVAKNGILHNPFKKDQ